MCMCAGHAGICGLWVSRAVKSQTVPGNEFPLGLCLALHVFIIMAHLNRGDCLVC